jgi:transglutaminase-like putative cysteine protease
VKHILTIPGLLLLSIAAISQNYNVSLIPDSLLKHANMVQRMDETKVIIHSIKSATVKHKFAYTILNEAGDSYAGYANLYDNFEKLTDASGKLYDAFGKQIKAIKKKDMEDVAYNDNFSLAGDGRIKHYNFYYKSYPYTVEFEEEQEYNGIYEFPAWQPLDGFDYSVQNSSYIIEMPADYKIRYKLVNGAKEPMITSSANSKILSWQAMNIKAIKYEPYQPSLSRLLPGVLAGPDDFEYGGFKGNLSTWENYGKFYAELYRGKDVLPDNIKAEVHRLTDGLTGRREKIKTLYNYLQQNTHYISIQLGIGGLQPFEAKFVAEKKYGDCKALSNYMVSMLREAGIKAYTAIIYGGENFPYIYEDFPRHYFNHVVACAPAEKDTLWLECTIQTGSAGYAGTFTGNRKALLVTEDGGKLVNTPRYTADDNLQIRNIAATIDENGNLTAEVFTHSTGIQQELQHSLLYDANPEQREKYLNRTLNLPTYKVEKIDYKEIKDVVPAMNEKLTITSPNYATVTGKRLFVLPNLFNKESKLPENNERRFDIWFKSSYKDVDSIAIQLPHGYTIESLPKDISLKNRYGNYSISFKVKDNTVEVRRIREQEEALFPAADYQQLYVFFDAIARADRSKLVMVKSEK